MFDFLGYAGKRVVIDGAASGMGLATTKVLVELGAEVYALDFKEVPAAGIKKYIQVDLRDKNSIDSALAQVPGKVDKLFCCAGLAGKPHSELDVVLVNFVGHRHVIESMVPRMTEGGAIAIISSVGGLGWMAHFANIKPMLETKSFEEAKAWLQAHPEVMDPRGYSFSKECTTAYAMRKSVELATRKIRVNVLSPATTASPMLADFLIVTGRTILEYWTVDGRFATPEEMGEPLVFLNSNMARFISGHDLVVDNSTIAKDMYDQLDTNGSYTVPGGPAIRALYEAHAREAAKKFA